MIQCHQCGHANPTGGVFCIECGTILVRQDAAGRPPTSASAKAKIGQHASTAGPWATLHVGDGRQAFELKQRDEFTLGRGDKNSASRPDIDLSPFDAYTNGVSRLHAVIRRRKDRIVLMDLDSANGTSINGRRLVSRHEAVLEDGDVLALGALKIRVRVKASR